MRTEIISMGDSIQLKEGFLTNNISHNIVVTIDESNNITLEGIIIDHWIEPPEFLKKMIRDVIDK